MKLKFTKFFTCLVIFLMLISACNADAASKNKNKNKAANNAAKIIYNTDGKKVWRESGKKRVVINDVYINDVDGAENLKWFEVSPSLMPEMKGSQEGIWLCDIKNPKRRPIFFNVKFPDNRDELEEAFNISLNPSKNIIILSDFSLKSGNLMLFDFNGRLLYKTTGETPRFWLDNYRCAFTFYDKNKKHGTSPDALPWMSAAILEIFTDGNNNPNEFLVTIMDGAEATATTSYQVVSYDTENNKCTVLKRSVPSPEYWDKFLISDENYVPDSEYISVDFPAAG